MYSNHPTANDPQIVNNPIDVRDAYFPTFERQILPAPEYSPYGNQHDGGVPLDTPWDVYARAYTPDPMTLVYGVPNLGSPGRGNPLLYPFTHIGLEGVMPSYTNFSDAQAFQNPTRVIVYVDDLQYQGISPLEAQPMLDAPEPWQIYTAQQRAGGG